MTKASNLKLKLSMILVIIIALTSNSFAQDEDSVQSQTTSVIKLTQTLNHHAALTQPDCGTPLIYNQYLDCPEFLLNKIISANEKSSLLSLIGSPDEMCSETIDHEFKTAGDLEKFLATKMPYSIDADPQLLSKGCLAPSELHPNALNQKKAKQAVATYYTLINRLKNGTISTLQSIASIDSLLGTSPLLKDVDCSDPHISAKANWCAQLKQNSCAPKGGLENLASETLNELQVIADLEKKILEVKDSAMTCGNDGTCATVLSTDQQKLIDSFQQIIASIQFQYPWTTGKTFTQYLSDHRGGMISKLETALNPENDAHPELTYQTVHDALYSQLVENRKAELDRLNRFKTGSSCLNSRWPSSSQCKDLDSIIDETPPITSLDLSRLPRDGDFGKRIQSESALSSVDCRWSIGDDKLNLNKIFYHTARASAIGATLAFVTGGLSIAVEAGTALGETADAAATAVDSGATIAKAVRAARMLTGINAGVALTGLKGVSSSCYHVLTQMDHAAEAPENQNSCPAQFGSQDPNSSTSSASRKRSCALSVVFAAAGALPLAAPYLEPLVSKLFTTNVLRTSTFMLTANERGALTAAETDAGALAADASSGSTFLSQIKISTSQQQAAMTIYQANSFLTKHEHFNIVAFKKLTPAQKQEFVSQLNNDQKTTLAEILLQKRLDPFHLNLSPTELGLLVQTQIIPNDSAVGKAKLENLLLLSQPIYFKSAQRLVSLQEYNSMSSQEKTSFKSHLSSEERQMLDQMLEAQ